MSRKISTKPPSGMRDFLPADVARREYVITKIREVYSRYGFVPLETPSIENLTTLLGKYGEEGDQLLYRLLHRRDSLARALEAEDVSEATLADQGLRYDLTVPLARVAAQYGSLPKFFKRYQIQPVWRADRPGKGRFREFYQCDVDITGTTSLVAEAEVCAAVAEVLQTLGFTDFEIRINHRELLRAMIRAAGIDSALEGTALVAVDKLDKVGLQGVVDELEQRGIDKQQAGHLLALMCCEQLLDPKSELHKLLAEIGNSNLMQWTVSGISAVSDYSEEELTTRRNEMLLGYLGRLLPESDESAQQALAQLKQSFQLIAHTPAGPHASLSPHLARGLSYYTGAIFEIAVADLAGSLGGGGRYDNLVGMFGKREIPAVGFSLGLERILVVMESRGMFPELTVGPEVLLCWKGVSLGEVLKVAHQLRGAGLRVEVYPEKTRKLGAQVKYADSLSVTFAAIVGPDEIAEQSVTLKHLASGKQQRVPLAEVGGAVALLNA